MWEEEYKKLFSSLTENQDLKSIDIEKLLQETVQFFEGLKDTVQNGSPEEKQKLVQMMMEIYGKIMAESQKIAEKVGMSEDELYVYSQNPNNFTPEQWRLIQETKQKLVDATKEITKTLKHEEPKNQNIKESEKKPPSSKEGASSDTLKAKDMQNKGHGLKKGTKGDWIKS